MKLLWLSSIVTLVGCASSSDQPAIEKPLDDKADTADRVCEALGEQPGCDACAVASWYGDGECDTFCTNPDSDCSVAQDIAAFLAGSDYTQSRAYYEVYGGGNYKVYGRLVATNLSQSNADAWAKHESPMIGTGIGLHYIFRSGTGGSVHTVQKQTNDGGTCNPLTPATQETVSVFSWQGGVPTLVMCAVAGSVTIGSTPAGKESFTFNVQFSDGTTWIDKVLEFD